jgi:hypothetical protein
MFGAGGQRPSGLEAVAWRASRLVDRWAGSRAGGGSVWVVVHLYFQCIVAWRRLSWARGSGCQSVCFRLCFTSAKCLQCVNKFPDSRSSCCLCLCPSCHFGSVAIFQENISNFDNAIEDCYSKQSTYRRSNANDQQANKNTEIHQLFGKLMTVTRMLHHCNGKPGKELNYSLWD